MRMRLNILSIALVVALLMLSGCGGSSAATDTTTDIAAAPLDKVTLSGKITYDLVPANLDYIGLNYDNISQEAVKAVRVDAVDASNQSVGSTETDLFGNYALSVPVNTQIKIRVSARMLKTGTPSWDVKVVDNSNSNALYVMEGALSLSGTTDSQRNLNASSGWDGSSYTGTRTAAPFAMLDTIYSAMQKVLGADGSSIFPPLVVNWYAGSVEGTYYTEGNLFIYGDEDLDTDEYDDHVIAHEWGHYYEDKFSRSDSIGGLHSGEDVLDIRVAFGEGWGNAFSGMALENPMYFDTYGDAQADGFNFNVESGTSAVQGWYSESSIERILYDLYDADDDGSDTLNLGFAPIHKIFTGAEKTTPAFTSIFTFITLLKNINAGDTDSIDAIVSSENIATITDIYGTGRTNKVSDYPYYSLTIGTPLSIQITTEYGTYNKLSNRKYVRFTITSAGIYTIKVQQTNGITSDPDLDLFDTSPFTMLSSSWNDVRGSEEMSISLSAGEYLLDVSEYNNIADAQFNVTIN